MDKNYPQPIDESMHLEKEWFQEAKKQTRDTLGQFIDHLMTDYQHDYGTICHAIAAAALAATYAADNSPQGGITGFQAGFIMWDFIKQWMYPTNTCGLKIVDYDNMLYPQYERHFDKTIPSHTWELLQAQAKELLKTEAHDAHNEVYKHWQSIANGQVPFGYIIEEN